MIKAKKSKVTPNVEVLNSFEEDYRKFYPGVRGKAVQKHQGLVDIQNDYERYLRSATENREHYRWEVEKYAQLLVEQPKLIAKALEVVESIDDSADIKKIDDMRRALKKIVGIKSVGFYGSYLKFTTHPLFTKIRTGDGSRRLKKRCIGAFECMVKTNKGSRDLKVNPLTYNSNLRPHWSVGSSNGACLGNWEPILGNLVNEGDMVGLIKMTLSYLKSTQDSGAYQRAHNWIEDRDARIENANGVFYPQFKVGDCIAYTNNYKMAIVSELNNEHEGKRYVRLVAGKSGIGNWVIDPAYWYETSRMVKITKSEYLRANFDETEYHATLVRGKKRTLPKKNPVSKSERIDALPEGCTNEEVLAIINGK